MLRAVRLNNFIKFEEDTLFKFDTDGVFFFMGENNSGKSAAFESIRRCLAMKFNCTFKMNFPDENNETYVVCDFVLPKETKEKFNGHNRLLSSFVHIPKCGYAKVVVLTDYENENEDEKTEDKGAKNSFEDLRNQNGEVYIDIIRPSGNYDQASNIECQIEKEDENIIIGNLRDSISCRIKVPIDFLNRVEKIMKRISEKAPGPSSMSTNSTKAAGYLETLCDHAVFTFGYRALGRVQWSNSTKLTEGTLNYSEAGERCEIIKWFQEKKDDVYDVEEADKIFRTLTGGEMFHFHFKDILLVKDEWDHETSVLKVPEGILEARHISLLLSCKPFKTLLLEEPDRGMHPQMVHRLSNLILPRVKDKVIIIISHNAAFLSPSFIPRTFKFCKIKEKSKKNRTITSQRYHIVNIGEVIQGKGNKMHRLLSSEMYANVIFAKRVLFVEGESDYIFVRGLFSHILHQGKQDYTRPVFSRVSELHESLHGQCYTKKDFENLECLLTSLHITMLNGHTNKDKWHEFCEGIKTPHIFLLDADAVMEKQKRKVRKRKPRRKLEEEKKRKFETSVHEQGVTGKLVDDWNESMKSDEETKEENKLGETKLNENESLRKCVNDVYERVKSLLQKAGMKERKDKKITTKSIINCLTKSFSLRKDIKQLDYGAFSEDEETNAIQKIIEISRVSQNQVDMEGELSNVDPRLIGKLYKQAMQGLKIPEYRKDGINTDGFKLSESKIVPGDARNTPLQSGWLDARKELLKNWVFVWKNGSIEDAFLETILLPEACNKDYPSQEDSDDEKEKTFTKYLAFHALNMFLKLERFQERKDKNKKLYINSDDDDVKESIDRVLSFCTKNSDIIMFVHFLVDYANNQFDYQEQM